MTPQESGTQPRVHRPGQTNILWVDSDTSRREAARQRLGATECVTRPTPPSAVAGFDWVVLSLRGGLKSQPEWSTAETVALVNLTGPRLVLDAGYGLEEIILAALESGAHITVGPTPVSELCAAIERGGLEPPPLMELAQLVEVTERAARLHAPRRLFDVYRLTMAGLSPKEMAVRLGVAAPTVRRHLDRLWQIMGCTRHLLIRNTSRSSGWRAARWERPGGAAAPGSSAARSNTSD